MGLENSSTMARVLSEWVSTGGQSRENTINSASIYIEIGLQLR